MKWENKENKENYNYKRKSDRRLLRTRTNKDERIGRTETLLFLTVPSYFHTADKNIIKSIVSYDKEASKRRFAASAFSGLAYSHSKSFASKISACSRYVRACVVRLTASP